VSSPIRPFYSDGGINVETYDVRTGRHMQPGGQLIIDVFDPRLDLLAQERYVPRREVPALRHPVTG
jgi:hypothetical protein